MIFVVTLEVVDGQIADGDVVVASNVAFANDASCRHHLTETIKVDL